MDQRQRKTDGDRREARGRAAIGRPHDDPQEESGQHDLDQQPRPDVIAARRAIAEAVRGKAVCREIIGGTAARDIEEQERRDDRAEHLRYDIERNVARVETPACPQADGDCGVEVTARNMADRIGHGDDRQTESESDAEQSDADIGKGGGQNRATAAAEHKPECADEFGQTLLDIRHDDPPPRRRP